MAKIADRILQMFRATEGVSSFSWMLYDALIAISWYYIASLLRLGDFETIPTNWNPLILALAAVTAGNALGLYERRTLLSRIQLLMTLVGVTAVILMVLVLYVNLVVYEQIGRWILFIIGTGFYATAAFPRLIGHYAVMLFNIRTMALADKDIALRLKSNLEAEDECYEFVGYCCDKRLADESALGGIEDLLQIARENKVDVLVVSRKYQYHPIALEACFKVADLDIQIQDEESFWETFLEQVQPELVDKATFFNIRMNQSSHIAQMLKRIIDIIIASLGLLITAPVMLLAALAIRFTSPGPIIFRQRRCGRFEKEFWIYKFRTMVADAEKNGAQWAATDDPRVTPLGAFLRKTRLDELPQFWNVLKGDMSLVGPRPERPELVGEIEKSVPYFTLRHWARPGLTGLAQIRFRYAATMDDAREKMRYDLYYIKNWSLFLDLQIILRTFSTIMKGSR
ncbi:MAG: sugar transferase [Candidatus Sumerlaeota bacterium]